MSMDIHRGVLGLISSANKRSKYQGEKHHFRGDLIQMSRAQAVAIELGLETDIEGGIPFVTSEKDFDEVIQHIIEHRIDGWWHYVSNEEYRQMKGK